MPTSPTETAGGTRVAPYEESLKHVLAGFREVPPAQHIVSSLMRMMNSEDPSVEEVAQLIRVDSSLATAVLRMSNSAFYAMSVPADNVDEAVVRLGYGEVIRLVSLKAISDLSEPLLPVYGWDQEQIWEVNVLTATIMERLADRIGFKKETAYSAGLMHGIGRWVIATCITRGEVTRSAPPGPFDKVIAWEKELTGNDYGEIGGRLMERWNYPENLRRIITWQNDPLIDDIPNEGAAMLNVAVKAAFHTVFPHEHPVEKLNLDPDILKAAGTDFIGFHAHAGEAKEELKEIKKLLIGRKPSDYE